MLSKHHDLITKEQKDTKCGICELREDWNKLDRGQTLGGLQRWIQQKLKTYESVVPEFKNEEVGVNEEHEGVPDEWKELSYSDAIKK